MFGVCGIGIVGLLIDGACMHADASTLCVPYECCQCSHRLLSISTSHHAVAFGGMCYGATTLGSYTATPVSSPDLCVGTINSTTGVVNYFQSFGTTSEDGVYAAAVDSSGNAYFGGERAPGQVPPETAHQHLSHTM
jgi:hypothetical protein